MFDGLNTPPEAIISTNLDIPAPEVMSADLLFKAAEPALDSLKR